MEYVVASLTTSPTRIHKIYDTLKSISSQSRRPDRIILNLPYMFERTGEQYTIPRFFEEFPRLYVNWIETDYGPVTKLLPTLSLVPKNTFIWVVDDDQKYLGGELEFLLKNYRDREGVYCLSGLVSDPRMRIVDKNGEVDMFEAYAGVLFRRDMFEDDFKVYIEKAIGKVECRTSDDLMVSMYLRRRGYEIWRVGSMFVNMWLHWNMGGVLEYGHGPDALYKLPIAKSTIHRYLDALPILNEILDEIVKA